MREKVIAPLAASSCCYFSAAAACMHWFCTSLALDDCSFAHAHTCYTYCCCCGGCYFVVVLQEGHRMMLEQHAVQEHKRRQTLAALGDTSALLAGDVHHCYYCYCYCNLLMLQLAVK
jgi:hypothetical protein